MAQPATASKLAAMTCPIDDDDDSIMSIDDIDLGTSYQSMQQQKLTQQDINMLSRLESKTSKTSPIKVKLDAVKEWFTEKKNEYMDTDNYTAATSSAIFSQFMSLLFQLDDQYIDKLLEIMVKLANFTGKVLHGLCLGLCVGLGFILSFLFEWLFLTIKKWNNEFDPNDPVQNERVYWDYVKRSLVATIGAVIASASTGAVVAAIMAALTEGLGCVVMIGIIVIVGSAVKFGIKWLWNKNRRMIYNSLTTLCFLNTHKTFSHTDLKKQYDAMRTMAKNSIRDPVKRNRQMAELKAAYQVLDLYLKTRDKENGFLAAKVEAYIIEKEKASCLIM